MANRRFEMYQYRQIIVQLRAGETIRAIARSGLAGRKKIQFIQNIAKTQGWLDKNTPLPDYGELVDHFQNSKPTIITQSKTKPYESLITQWSKQGIQATTIHAVLTERHGFTGSYFSIHRLIKKIRGNDITHITMPLDFKPGGQKDTVIDMSPFQNS